MTSSLYEKLSKLQIINRFGLIVSFSRQGVREVSAGRLGQLIRRRPAVMDSEFPVCRSGGVREVSAAQAYSERSLAIAD